MRRCHSLSGLWRYAPVASVTIGEDGAWRTSVDALPAPGEMPVPSHWARQELGDFFGTVRFARQFDAPDHDPDESVWLIFGGVDYFATVRLNGREAARHEGYFQTWDVDITDFLQHGPNSLEVDVTCPREEAGAVWPNRKRMIKGILSHWDCRPGSWDAETGQDIHSGGIWGDVTIEVRPTTFVRAVRTQTVLTPSNDGLSQDIRDQGPAAPPTRVARVLISVDVQTSGGRTMPPGLATHVTIGDYAARVSVPEGVVTATCELTVTVAAPRLWWTWDHGEPYLYPCTVALQQDGQILDALDQPVGLRELWLDPDTGAWTLNGRRIFVRGTNIVPTLWLGEYDAATIAQDIALLKDAHMNGVRVCVHVNREELYDALDRAGILVWQDFALQWGYEQSDSFIAEPIRQVRDMVRQLRHHPCIALWCCQNESTQFNREVLDPLLAQAAREEDSSRYVRPTSEFSEHLYHGWYGGHLTDYEHPPSAPIITEFGAQALPSVEEMVQMLGPTWPPDWREMAYHDFQYHQTFHIAQIPLGSGWQEFVEASQSYQAALLKTAIERFRRAKYAPVGGIFQFMFMDCWPAITWSIVSHGRCPKLGYDAVQQAMQPVLVGAQIERSARVEYADRGRFVHPRSIMPWVVNDRHESVGEAHIAIYLRDTAGATTAEIGGTSCDVPADGVLELPRLDVTVPKTWDHEHCVLGLQLLRGDTVLSENAYPIQLLRNSALASPPRRPSG